MRPSGAKAPLVVRRLRHPSASSGQALKSCPFKTGLSSQADSSISKHSFGRLSRQLCSAVRITAIAELLWACGSGARSPRSERSRDWAGTAPHDGLWVERLWNRHRLSGRANPHVRQKGRCYHECGARAAAHACVLQRRIRFEGVSLCNGSRNVWRSEESCNLLIRKWPRSSGG